MTMSETSTNPEPGVNKSQLIREINAQNPGLKAAEIAKMAEEAGTPVSVGLVYQALRPKDAKPGRRGRKPAGYVPPSDTAGGDLDSQPLLPAEQVGAPLAPTAAAVPRSRPARPAAADDGNALYIAMRDFVDAAGGINKAIDILTLFKN